jgi:predicted ester cyclase
MSEAQNEEIIRKFIELWEKGKTEYFDDIFSSEFEHHGFGKALKGISAYKSFYQTLTQAFKNLKFTIDETIHSKEGSTVFRWRATALFEGEFCGCKPTNKEIQFGGLTLLQIKNGKATAGWFYNDIEATVCEGCKNCR